MIIKLKKSYTCKYGNPVIHSVDTDLFELTYYMHCMNCNFCNDQCCSYGADIDMQNVDRIMKYADELERFTGIKRESWFFPKKRGWDKEYPGHDYTRTRKMNGACVFLNRKGRGCLLHSFALVKEMDYHEIKPFFCSFFPFTYMEGVLCTPEEIDDKTLGCYGDGPTLYEGAKDEVRYYFGDEIIEELDAIDSDLRAKREMKINIIPVELDNNLNLRRSTS